MKSCGGGGKTAINPKWNLNLVKKVFPAKSRGISPAHGRGAAVDIIVRKLSLSIFRRGIVRMTEPGSSSGLHERAANNDYLRVTAP